MNVLGIDTSGAIGSIALRRDGRCVELLFLSDLGRRHARTLVPEVIAFLARHELRLVDIDGVAVNVGPGSFTGLRIGITFAKTLAYANRAKLAAVESFAACIEPCVSTSDVAVIADAQRKGVMLGRYKRKLTGQWSRIGDIELVALDRLAPALKDVSLIMGPGVSSLTMPLPANIQVVASRGVHPNAATVARLGESSIAQGNIADAWTLEPLYVRKSGAEEARSESRRPSDRI